MLYMVIEKYKDKEAVYKRFHKKGRMMPEGVSYVNSWVTEDGNTCYQINKAESIELSVSGSSWRRSRMLPGQCSYETHQQRTQTGAGSYCSGKRN